MLKMVWFEIEDCIPYIIFVRCFCDITSKKSEIVFAVVLILFISSAFQFY